MIAEASAASSLAQQNAAEAARVAAVARGAAAEANSAADQAKKAADAANTYANQAKEKAKQAEASGAKAAQAAKTAAGARDAALRDTVSAEYSAQRAEKSKWFAQASASEAYTSATKAHDAAQAAGQDARTAAQSANQAFQVTATKSLTEYVNQVLVQSVEEVAKRQEQSRDAFVGRGIEKLKHTGRDIVENWDWDAPKLPGIDDLTDFFVHTLDRVMDHPLDAVVGAFGLLGSAWTFSFELTQVAVPSFVADGALCGISIVSGDAMDKSPSCSAAKSIVGDQAGKALDLSRKLPFGHEVSTYLEQALTKAGICPTPNSFPAGTRVLMADGTTKPIEQIGVGDQVTATDPATGRSGGRTVDATILTPDDRDFTDLNVAAGSGSLTATDHHPFWAENRHRWLDAADLIAGDELRTPGGSTARITGTKHRNGLQAAYNLTVRDLHTYYVLAGNTPVLVHNSGGLCAGEDAYRIDEHVKPRHTSSGDKTDGKSIFNDGEDLYVLARGSDGKIGQYQSNTGRIQYVVDAGRIIGTDKNGLPTRFYTIIRTARPEMYETDYLDFGDLVTMHPGTP
ncbi:polymorphic toxin-type HINT domain-containing protein [Kitasatospora aburaviensis]